VDGCNPQSEKERKAKKKRPAREIELEIDSLSDSELRKVLEMLPLSQIRRLVGKLDSKTD
jgi:hypothetical protein